MTYCLLQVFVLQCWFLVGLYPVNSGTKVHCLLYLLSEVVLGHVLLGLVCSLSVGVVWLLGGILWECGCWMG